MPNVIGQFSFASGDLNFRGCLAPSPKRAQDRKLCCFPCTGLVLHLVITGDTPIQFYIGEIACWEDGRPILVVRFALVHMSEPGITNTHIAPAQHPHRHPPTVGGLHRRQPYLRSTPLLHSHWSSHIRHYTQGATIAWIKTLCHLGSQHCCTPRGPLTYISYRSCIGITALFPHLRFAIFILELPWHSFHMGGRGRGNARDLEIL
jgi:hypothetical protein